MSQSFKENQAPDYSFSNEKRQGVYEAIALRRDIRSFLPNPIPDEKLGRILEAANMAPSVGFMQPWDFIIVKDFDTRNKLHAHVDSERRHAADGFEGKRKESYSSPKLEGILDAPVNILVTCDPSRFGPSVIGRNTIRETDVFSAVCAVQNLWLAARAEGIGVGWVSILKNEFLRHIFHIPAHIIPVAYLCVGYTEDFDDTPLLQKIGWLPKRELDETIHSEEWGKKPAAG